MIFELFKRFINRFVLASVLFATIFVGLLLHTNSSWSDTGKIMSIEVLGTQRIDPETVISYSNLKVGDGSDPDKLDAALKILFKTGLFADVDFVKIGEKLVINVIENPVINRIAFEGNKRIESKDLELELQLKPRLVFTRTKVQQDVQRLLTLYRLSGRFAAQIAPKIIRLEQNRVNLVFEIDEGPLSKIRNISFIGNKNFSDSELASVIHTKEYAFWRILTSTDTYDPDRLSYDRELLRRFYLNRGYIDFTVLSAVAELTPDQKDFVVTFSIDEGERYKFGKMSLISNLEGLQEKQLSPFLITKAGDWYTAKAVNETIDSISDQLGVLGFAFVKVRPISDRRRKERIVNLNYTISKTRRVFLERIDIEGNLRTLDKVVRREFDIVEGDAFNISKLRRAKRRIRNLGFFAKADVKRVMGQSEESTIIKVQVEEKSTGEISFGVGFSSLDGPLANVGIRERNLLGRGQDLNFNFQGSASRQEFKIGFTEPYFMERRLSAGFDLFQVTTDRQTDSSFDERKAGGSLKLGYVLGRDLSQSLKYQLKKTEIRNVDETASTLIKEQEGTNTVSQISQTTVFDKRDNRYEPKDGYVVSLTNELAGLSGDTQHLRTRIKTGYFVPLFEDKVLSFTAESGHIIGINQDVNIGERFFLGGQTVRGFSNSGIGPRDGITNDALGGNTYYAGSIELRFPLGLSEELGINGSLFTDVGSLWSLDRDSSDILDSSGVRASAGLGVSWATGLGLMRVDFASALLKEDWDETEFVRFSFGTRF
ncbi:MAG: outer membrane protein assembly factor BamA [Rhodospirillaceae bacterium]|nr:outer membrane protein assembly factor BamA [Rhodospirillaceae bacterium]|tara:strand:- start:17946 stop:20249 length:2304 start_codon:yes stop_codon:yes gene_type:complete